MHLLCNLYSYSYGKRKIIDWYIYIFDRKWSIYLNLWVPHTFPIIYDTKHKFFRFYLTQSHNLYDLQSIQTHARLFIYLFIYLFINQKITAGIYGLHSQRLDLWSQTGWIGNVVFLYFACYLRHVTGIAHWSLYQQIRLIFYSECVILTNKFLFIWLEHTQKKQINN